ncbi:MAG TPA: carbohydrate ABC transporter permease [Phototrophicaceae bacterium]|nr:carbohydrate ABC transporter permease [Phototrophicaceae bacterium]
MATTTLSRPTPVVRPARPRSKIAQSIVSHALLIIVGAFFFIPFLWMISTAFKSDQDVFRTPPSWLPHDNATVEVNGQTLPLYTVTDKDGSNARQLALVKIAAGQGTFLDPANPSADPQTLRMRYATPILVPELRWQNFPDALNRATRPGMNVNFWTYFKNSLLIAVWSIIGTLVSCTPVAYGFARIHWPGRDLVFVLVLATMMLPFQVTMIPLYIFFTDTLHWGNTILPLIVPTFFANGFDIFLLRQFFRTIPEELCDAARVDGASEFQIFLQVVLPLSTPVLATIAVFTFLYAWNDFTAPLLYLTSPQNYTMAIGLQDFQGQHTVAWNQLMAASVVFTIPIVIAFFFAQRTFIQGIKLTGLKE